MTYRLPVLAADVSPHGGEQGGQVGHLGLLGAVAQDGRALGQGGGHQQVLGAGDGLAGEGEIDPAQTVAAGGEVIPGNEDLGTHAFQPLEVEVDLALADGAASGHRDPGRAAAGQHGAEQQHRRPSGAGDLVGDHRCAQRRHGDAQLMPLKVPGQRDVGLGLGADLAQGGDHHLDVLHQRQIAENDRFGAEADGGQLGQGGVLGPGNGHAAGQRPASMDRYDDVPHVVKTGPAGRLDQGTTIQSSPGKVKNIPR